MTADWQPPPPPPPPAQPAYRHVEGFAIAALVVGLVSVVAFPLIVLAVLGIVFGVIARRRIKGDPNRTGAGMSLAGTDGNEEYLDMPYEELPLSDYEIFPTRASWGDGNRRIICALGTEDGSPLVGSRRAG